MLTGFYSNGTNPIRKENFEGDESVLKKKRNVPQVAKI